MYATRRLELWVGFFVALGLVAVFFLAMRVSNLSGFQEPGGYTLTAYFSNVGGLKPQAPVTMAGVRVGRVTAIQLDERSFQARVTLKVESQFDELPEDTSASILTSGLLGEQYLGLEPGGSDQFLAEGDTISYTQSALVLEQIIGQFLFSKAAGE